MLGLLLVLCACACIYLASPKQRWRARPLPARPARIVGCILLTLAWCALSQHMQPLTATFVWATALMLVFVALPYIGALIPREKER